MAKSNQEAQYDYRLRQHEVEIDVCEDESRRNRLEADPREWLKWYLAEAFPLDWSSNHLAVIDQTKACMEQGGFQAIAMPRGSGKTTLCEGMALWGILSGHARYLLLVGATSAKGKALLKTIKTWLRFSDRLRADYPEVCQPFKALRGTAMRARYQTHWSEPTLIEWNVDRLVFPSTPRVASRKDRVADDRPNPCSGSIIDCDGITGDIRGHVVAMRDGTQLRPDACIVDDPQTKESAKSPEQSRFRKEVVVADIAGSAGPNRKMSVLVPCTVIHKSDMADQILDRTQHPDFRGIRTGMLTSWPNKKAMKVWEDGYNAARLAGIEAEDDGKMARDFYVKNRSAMDAGASVSWPDRKLDNEASAIQHAMNLYLKLGRAAFMSEYQNDPEDEEKDFVLTEAMVQEKVNRLPRRTVPENAKILTAFADVNHYGLSWAVVGFAQGMTAFVADYGVDPKRGVIVQPNATEKERKRLIYEALVALGEKLSGLEFTRGGQPVKINLFMVDRGYEPDVVHQYAQYARLPFQVMPSRGFSGQYYRPTGRNVIGTPREQCHMTDSQFGQFIAHCACYWREVAQRAFLSPVGTPGGASLYGKHPAQHIDFGMHMVAEPLIEKVTTDKGTMWRWGKRPGQKNDLADAFVGCYVGAAWLGMGTSVKERTPFQKRPQRRRVKR